MGCGATERKVDPGDGEGSGKSNSGQRGVVHKSWHSGSRGKEDLCEFRTSLIYTVRLKLGVVARAYNASPWEVESVSLSSALLQIQG